MSIKSDIILDDKIIRNTVIYHTFISRMALKPHEGSDEIYPCLTDRRYVFHTDVNKTLADLMRHGHRLYFGKVGEIKINNARLVMYLDLSKFIHFEPPCIVKEGVIYPYGSREKFVVFSELRRKLAATDIKFLRLFDLCVFNILIDKFMWRCSFEQAKR